MSNTDCCGNCQHFLNEDIEGIGWCELKDKLIYCGCRCPQYKKKEDERDRGSIKEVQKKV